MKGKCKFWAYSLCLMSMFFLLSNISGISQGKTEITYNSGVYTGQVNEESAPDGQGQFVWKNGDKYEGTFTNGQITGKGTFYYANGDMIYEGDFVNGLKHGTGTFVWESGQNEITTYDGTFFNGKMTGIGTFKVHSASIRNNSSKVDMSRLHNIDPNFGISKVKRLSTNDYPKNSIDQYFYNYVNRYMYAR
ncbi:MAG: hypothetical protein AB9833_02080 [Bacteroidales bacterium]